MISIFLLAAAVALSVFFGICYYAYDYCFKTDKGRQAMEYDIPDASFKPKAMENIFSLLATPFESVKITSHDGLRLYARYYHLKDGAPVAIMMHGYRSNYCRDGNGGFKLLRSLGFNILMPDQRAHGRSEGRVISFGVNERRDCLGWTKYVRERFGDDVNIVLMGVSMGAATVMMASDIVCTDNVKAIVADCGYTSPKEIIRHVAKNMHLPVSLSYFFAKTGVRIFGKLDIEQWSCFKSLEKALVPILFIHGEADGFVPCHMSKACFEKCASYKEILTVPKATHGVSYYIDTRAYTDRVCAFLEKFVEF